MNKVSTALTTIGPDRPSGPQLRSRAAPVKQRHRFQKWHRQRRDMLSPGWERVADDGASAARLHYQMRWLVAQEIDYFFEAPDVLASGGSTPSFLHEVPSGPKIIDFIAYKEEGVIREAG